MFLNNSKFMLFHIGLVVLNVLLFHLIGGKATLVSPIFDLYILLIFIVVSMSYGLFFSRKTMLILILTLFYFSIYVVRYYFFNDFGYKNNYELVRSSRFIYYLIMFIFISEVSINRTGTKVILQLTDFLNFSKLFFYTFLFSYIFQVVFLGVERPKLYSENNYEIPSLLILYSIYLSIATKSKIDLPRRSFVSLFVYAASLVSLSKSGVLEAMFVFVKSRMKTISVVNISTFVMTSIISILTVYIIFNLRSSGNDFSEIDRMLFLNVFISVVSEFEFVEYLFGKGLAREMPLYSCIELKYWATAISEDFSYCNATVFHSFLLKSLYEFGVIGTLLFLSTWFYFLSRFYGLSLGISIFTIIFICSLSVTGFSNSIVIWVVFLGTIIDFNYRDYKDEY